MKTFIATTAILAAMASSAVADTVRARVTSVEPRYQTVYQNLPTTQCQDVEVPVYGTVQGGDAAGGALAGMIIGGLIGKGATGNNDGAAAGAVIGGIIGADRAQNGTRQVITGYRIERQCSEVMVQQEVREIRDYFIRFEWNGVQGTAYTYNQYTVGQRIPVTVSIVAQ